MMFCDRLPAKRRVVLHEVAPTRQKRDKLDGHQRAPTGKGGLYTLKNDLFLELLIRWSLVRASEVRSTAHEAQRINLDLRSTR